MGQEVLVVATHAKNIQQGLKKFLYQILYFSGADLGFPERRG